MVLIELNENIEAKITVEKEKGGENKKNQAMPAYNQKLFCCDEIERSIGLRLEETLAKTSSPVEIKQVDSAIVDCSSNLSVTRYTKDELVALRNNTLSQQIPGYLFEPKLVNLAVMNAQTEARYIEFQLKLLTDRVKHINIGEWDPSLMQFFNRYQQAIVNYPGFLAQAQQQPHHPHQQQQKPPQPQRHVSFMEQRAAFLDKIPQYDRNNNFFDTITTTTAMMRPPSRAGQHQYNNNNHNAYQHNRPPPPMPSYHHSNRKGNSCAMDMNNGGNSGINDVSLKSSLGYFSDNDTSKSLDGSMGEEKGKDAKAMNKPDASINEGEPEWYSVPAAVTDVIDLHGFEDGMEVPTSEKKTYNNNNRGNGASGYGTASLAYRRSGYSQNNYQNNNNRVNTNYRQNNNNNFGGGQQFHQQQQHQARQQYGSGGFNNQHEYGDEKNAQRVFRNPLHYNKQTPSPQSPTFLNPRINPFFEMYRQAQSEAEKLNNFQALMNPFGLPTVPANLPTISDIEHTLKSSNYLASLMKGKQHSPLPTISHSVPQFFSNWPQQNSPTATVPVGPSVEQLQQHCDGIMRNAIMRKTQAQHQQQQQYQDEKPHFM